VFDGEIRHVCRTLLTLTRPYFGTASIMSNTLAVSTQSGGCRSTSWIEARPALRSRLSCARRVRIWFARLRASIRCTRDLSGVAAERVAVVWAAGGIEKALFHPTRQRSSGNGQIRFDLNLRSSSHLSRSSEKGCFPGLFCGAGRLPILQRAVEGASNDLESSLGVISWTIRVAARGSRKLSVPTATIVAAALDAAHAHDGQVHPRGNLRDLGQGDGPDRGPRSAARAPAQPRLAGHG